MRFGHSEVCLAHDPGRRHPESPDRIRAIRRRLSREHATSYAEGTDAPRSLLESVHEATYLDDLEAFCQAGGGEWDPDTAATAETWDAAVRSAGLAEWAARRALSGDAGRETPFSLGRPPGHHAEPGDAMGFCFLNNVAIAATAALKTSDVERVSVFDWDVHHGNGTQAAFIDDDAVLYVSIHEEGLYPGTGSIDERGSGDGIGTTLNVPLPSGIGDAGYDHVASAVVTPAIERYNPDLVLVSAGFDPHRHDPISRMRLSTEGFGRLAAHIKSVVDGIDAPLAFVLEGGYGLETLADGVAMVNQVFEGYDPASPSEKVPEAVRDRVETARAVHEL